jgi:hypothetical protein
MFLQPNDTSPDGDQVPDEVPEVIENDPDTVIEIPGTQRDNLTYAVIRSDDTLSLYTENGTVYPIQLEKRNWIEIIWSPENEYILARGSNNGAENLYLYDIGANSGKWITQYSESQTGVSSVVWSSDTTLYFIQGQGNNSWLHEFNVNTGQQILKIKQIEGQVVGASNGVALLIHGEDYLIYQSEEEVASLADLVKLGLEINEASLVDSEQVLIKIVNASNANFYYIYNIEQDEISIVEDNSSFVTVCIQEDVLFGYEIPVFEQTISLSSVDILEKEKLIEEDSYQVSPSLINKGSERCADSGIVLKTQESQSTEINWYYLSEGDIKELEFLDTATYVDVSN